MNEATRDALAIVGLFYLIATAAYLACRAVHAYITQRAAKARTDAPVGTSTGTRTRLQAVRVAYKVEAPLYGLPSVPARSFDEWLEEVDIANANAGRNVHNN